MVYSELERPFGEARLLSRFGEYLPKHAKQAKFLWDTLPERLLVSVRYEQSGGFPDKIKHFCANSHGRSANQHVALALLRARLKMLNKMVQIIQPKKTCRSGWFQCTPEKNIATACLAGWNRSEYQVLRGNSLLPEPLFTAIDNLIDANAGYRDVYNKAKDLLGTYLDEVKKTVLPDVSALDVPVPMLIQKKNDEDRDSIDSGVVVGSLRASPSL
jgi:hypothetical protein